MPDIQNHRLTGSEVGFRPAPRVGGANLEARACKDCATRPTATRTTPPKKVTA